MRSALVLLLVVGCSRPAPPPAPTNASCEGCHVEEARAHGASLHRRAFTDTTFQQSLALEEPKQHAFCNGCHAPDGAEDGVGCIACHGSTPRTKAATRARPAPHALTVDPSFGTEAACAKCHQFTFDDRRADLVQKTLSEHAASAIPNVPCADCHMPKDAGRSSHAFRAGHDLPFLREALGVRAKRVGADRVRIVILPGTGHDFPTGDMFRRAQLLVFGEDADGSIVSSAERLFGRRWGMTPDGSRIETADTRIHGKFDEELTLDAPRPIARIRWEIRFQRILSARGNDDVTLVSNDVIAAGTLE